MRTENPRLPIPTLPVVSLRVVRDAEIPGCTSEQAIRTGKAVYDLARDELCSRDREVFAVLHLNCRGRPLSLEIVSIGSLDASICHPREVFKAAILQSSASIILVHNHPSGDPTPSEDDLQTTKRLVEAGRILGIPVTDHVVVSAGAFVSMQETCPGWFH